jgi:hypothetical protein
MRGRGRVAFAEPRPITERIAASRALHGSVARAAGRLTPDHDLDPAGQLGLSPGG